MLFKTIIAAFVVSSGDALRMDGLNTRRAAIASTASAMMPLAAFAVTDAEIYQRADQGKLNAARAIERAKTGDLADGKGATCDELDALIAVDREAVAFEKDKLATIGSDGSDDDGVAMVVQQTEDRLQQQIFKLQKRKKEKECPGVKLKKASDFQVYKRADEGALSSARVIQRAKDGELVDGSSATCAELEKIITVDKKAVKFEKDKLEAMGDKAKPADVKSVAEAEKAIEAQLVKLAGKQAEKGCK